MRRVIYLFLILWCSALDAQQLPAWSSYYETGFVWNPALTAKWNMAETTVNHRQDWIGFEGAPQYTNISFQTPFISGYHTKSAMGVFVERDKVGPQEKYGAAISYNYRFRPQWFGKRDDVLGLGMLFNIAQYRFNITNAVIYDPGQLAINTQDVSQVIHPNVAMGAFYISVSDFYAYQKSHFYAGLSINQLITSPIATFRGRGDNIALFNIQATRHATLHVGFRHIPFRKPYFYEPSVMVIYGGGHAVHAMAHMRFELIDEFWLAGGLATTGEFFGQAGVILDKYSFLKKVVKDGSLRVGLKASWNLGSVGQLARPGLEFYGAYHFVLE